MKLNRSTMEVLASILGFIIFVVVIMAAMNYFRQGTEDYAEAQRAAGKPITLAESISGSEGVTETAAVEGASAVTATTPVTDTPAVTGTTALTTTETVTTTETATTEVAATAPLSETAAVTTTSETTATAVVTESAPVTASAPIEVAVAVTTTETVTESTEVSATPTVAPTAEPTTAPTEAAPAAAIAVTGVPAAADVAPIFAKGTCVACHVIPNVPGAVGVIGPDLTTIGAVGATRIAGYTAEEYIRESILNPNAFIAPECPTGPCLAGVMLQNLADTLTPEEIDLVVAYLAVQGVQ